MFPNTIFSRSSETNNSKKYSDGIVHYSENDIVLNLGDYIDDFLVVTEPNSVQMSRTLPNGIYDIVGTLPINACIGLIYHTCWDKYKAWD